MGTDLEEINTVKTRLISETRATLISQGMDEEAIDNIFDEISPMIDSNISTYIASESTNNTCDYSGLINEFASRIHEYKDQITSDGYADIDNTIDNMYMILDTYRKVYEKHFNRMVELSDTRKDENKQLIKNVDNSNLLVNTNKRKVVYEKRQFEGLQTYRLVLLIAFYLLLVIYLIFGNFFPSRLYRIRLFMYVFLSLSIAPLIIKYVVRLLYFIMRKINYFLNNRAPKNVYVNI
jgi:hypothetical protein